MKTYVAFVRDHSASMRSLKEGAKTDFNLMVEGIKNTRIQNSLNITRATIVECGSGWNAAVVVKETGTLIENIHPLSNYVTDGGGTPLWESVLTAITNVADVAKYDISRYQEQIGFLVIVTTDGYDNRSTPTQLNTLITTIKKLQATDLWTFVFRVPVGHKKTIVNLGIPEGNVVEWEQTTESQSKTTDATTAAIDNYYTTRSMGATSTMSFYTTDLSNVTIKEVKSELNDITDRVDVARVWTGDDGIAIRGFCIKSFGEYSLGKGFYELTKAETVQDNKKVILKHLKKGRYFTGTNDQIRNMLNLPAGNLKIHPGDHGDFEIYVQSTSVNRKLYKNSNVVYWKDA